MQFIVYAYILKYNVFVRNDLLHRMQFIQRIILLYFNKTYTLTFVKNYIISNFIKFYYNFSNAYIDANYLLNVTAELKSKGVTMDNLTQEELDDLERLRQYLISKKNIKQTYF